MYPIHAPPVRRGHPAGEYRLGLWERRQRYGRLAVELAAAIGFRAQYLVCGRGLRRSSAAAFRLPTVGRGAHTVATGASRGLDAGGTAARRRARADRQRPGSAAGPGHLRRGVGSGPRRLLRVAQQGHDRRVDYRRHGGCGQGHAAHHPARHGEALPVLDTRPPLRRGSGAETRAVNDKEAGHPWGAPASALPDVRRRQTARRSSADVLPRFGSRRSS